jgi:hypothetical protein
VLLDNVGVRLRPSRGWREAEGVSAHGPGKSTVAFLFVVGNTDFQGDRGLVEGGHMDHPLTGDLLPVVGLVREITGKAQGIPADRVENALQIIKENGKYAGVIRDTPTGPFINLDSPGVHAPAATPALPEDDEHDEVPAGAGQTAPPPPKPPSPSAAFDPKADHVFISHGKQRAIVTQIKELLEFGKFTPVVSVEREATAISVPEKVFEDMRSCAAGIIHVGGEGKYLDPDGNEHTKLNDNVLIEIGAAMALYGKKIILLVEKGVALPSNLQGLYRCEFEGDKLEYDSMMKLLKTFSQFR